MSARLKYCMRSARLQVGTHREVMLSNEISLGSIPPATTGASVSFIDEFNPAASSAVEASGWPIHHDSLLQAQLYRLSPDLSIVGVDSFAITLDI